MISKTLLNSKDILSISDLSTSEINSILSYAVYLKQDLKNGKFHSDLLKGKILGMVFQKPSTRTRVSFETAMMHLGGDAIYLGMNDLQLSRGESIEDTSRTLSLYLDFIMARVYNHKDLQVLASSSTISVINGLSDLFHPCQILADLLTIKEFKKKFKDLNLAWIGDGYNVCHDLLLASGKLGMNMTAACPEGYEPKNWIVDLAKKEAEITGAKISVVREPVKAVIDADIVVTDTFISIGQEQELSSRKEIFVPKYQVNLDLLKSAKSDVIFMHCLPAKRGLEVTSDVIDNKNISVVWEEAENRLHVQKALLCLLVNKKNKY